jgi:hypothetical protein
MEFGRPAQSDGDAARHCTVAGAGPCIRRDLRKEYGMTETGRAPPYAVVVTRHRDGYGLRIPELLLTVRAEDLQDGYRRLRKRQEEVVELARSIDALDELPSPAEPPVLKSLFR